MREFTSASTLQFFSTRQPRYVKVSMNWTSPCPEWSANGVVSSVCPDGRTTIILVFAVLTVRPVKEQVESNDLNISSRSLLESSRSAMSSTYAMLLRRSSLVDFFRPPTSFCSPRWYSRGRPFCWWFHNDNFVTTSNKMLSRAGAMTHPWRTPV